MNPNQVLWEKGDFTKVAALMRVAGDAFVASLNIVPPLRVLDLGSGDGTTAFPLAERGAEVVAIDIAANLVAAGNRRVAQAGLRNITFQQGDATDLREVPDASFDLTLSMFGAMFAPKPESVAKEMVRVTKPGGRIVMTNWIPNDPTSYVSQLLRVSMAFSPPPPEGFISPMMWGVDANVLARFAAAGVGPEKISLRKDTFAFTSPDTTPAGLIDIFRQFYGPTMNAFEAATANGTQDELARQLVAVAEAQNRSTGGGISMGATFLRVEVHL